MIFVNHDKGLLLLPMELQSAAPGGHCTSSRPPPTQIAQSQLETTSPLAEGRSDDENSLAACTSV